MMKTKLISIAMVIYLMSSIGAHAGHGHWVKRAIGVWEWHDYEEDYQEMQDRIDELENELEQAQEAQDDGD
jgi:hypothetical protein